MKNIKLFIANKEVDLPSNVNFPFTYQSEQLNNPSIVKNSFSKSIKIEGTPNNNKIFGEIYKLDREQMLQDDENYIGAYFNPQQRTDFKLYDNGNLIESGYMQLNSISIKNKIVEYAITLYGGLGDFFYSLMYNEEGEKLTLADLNFGQDLTFRIDKDFVYNSWLSLGRDGTGTVYDLLTFVPSYNGKYDSFDNGNVIINIHNSKIYGHLSSGLTENGDNNIINVYKPYMDSFVLGSMEKEYTEWDMGDLRSYMQRPALRFRKLLEAICNPENNGGFTVNLDNTFFNDNNPYYNNAYLTLPLLTSITATGEAATTQAPLINNSDNLIGSDIPQWVGVSDGQQNQFGYQQYLASGDSFPIMNETINGVEWYYNDLSVFNPDSTVKARLRFRLRFVPDSSVNADFTRLYLSHSASNYSVYTKCWNGLFINTAMIDNEAGTSIGLSNSILFSNSIPVSVNETQYPSSVDIMFEGGALGMQAANFDDTEMIDGYFELVNGQWIYTSNGNSEFTLAVNCPLRKQMFLNCFSYWQGNINGNFNLCARNTVNSQVESNYLVRGTVTVEVLPSSEFIVDEGEFQIRSGTEVTQEMLLKTDYTPADVLLDYTKLFGLVYLKDIDKKTINILSRNTFYNGKTINIDDRIDISNEVKIEPSLTSNKYLVMKYDNGGSHFDEKYNNEYNLEYGQKRINTNYNFNQTTEEMYKGNVLKNVIQTLDKSPCYRTFYNTSNPTITYPAFEFEGVEITMPLLGNLEETIDVPQIEIKNTTAIDWNATLSGYDVFSKPCFYKLNDEEKTLNDISASLVFYTGKKELKNRGGEIIPMYLTDDLNAMFALNEEVCYLYTESENDARGNKIANKIYELPQFSRYIFENDNVTDSLDFAVPKENYLGQDITYDDAACIYNRFWSKYFSDRYNINTKKVTCNVNLQGYTITQEFLRNFFYFNNAIWVINKIENYNPNSYNTTKVTFIKVRDKQNYTSGQKVFFNKPSFVPPIRPTATSLALLGL